MNAAAADARARLRAQTDFAAPLLLEAGAGTGKTAVLVARLLAWCLGPGWERASGEGRERASAVLRRVVAITFTETATAEMASRVSDAFETLRRGELPVGVAEAALPPAGVREVRAAAFRLALDQLRVHTIHAFCYRLLLAHPLEAGVHPRLQVDADGQALAALAREVIEECLPVAYGEPEDPDWARLADAGVGPRELEAALASLLSEGVTPGDLDERPGRVVAFVEGLRAELEAFVALEAGRLAGLRQAKAVAAGARALADAASVLARAKPADGAGLEALKQQLASLPGWDKIGERLAGWARGEIAESAKAALGADLAPLGERADALRPLLEHLERFEAAPCAAARRVLQGLVAEVHERLRRRGVASFGALLRGARDLLVQPELRARVRSELDQLLVDEFQDTDALQCEILRALALEPPDADRPTLFLVGDPKQSIYGWRNADLRAYEALKRPLVAMGRVDSLVVNFRSAPAILDEVERVVAPVMEEVAGLQPRFERLVPSQQTRRLGGFCAGGRRPVEHWLPARVDPASGEVDDTGGRELALEREARAVAADVAALREGGVELDDVALLLRATGDFESVLAALRDAGIPYVVERETDFYQRREIVDAVALVRALLDPHDQLALVAALRSSAVGVPDAAWLPLYRQGFPARVARVDGVDSARLADALAAVRAAAAALPPDVPEAARIEGWPRALELFVEALHELRGVYASATPERFVEALRERVLLEASEAARYLGEHRVANLDRFFRDLVQALDEAAGSAASLVAFLRRAGSIPREHSEGRPRALAGDAVHVLTIHRAKGLDWQHVYLLGLDRGPGRDDARRSAVLRRGSDLGLVLLGWPEPGLPVVAAERAAVEAAERVRLLYVAATRAKQRLVIGARRARASEWRRARSHAELLAARRDTPSGWIARAARAGEAGFLDAHAVRRRLVEASLGEAAPARRAPFALADAETVQRDEDRLRAERARAEVRAAREFSSTASAEAHAKELRADALGADDETPRARPERGDEAERRVALAAGTAVHALLEAGDLADASTALERAVASAASPSDRRTVWARARAVWERFAAGPLAARLAALAPHVLARELPVFLAPDDAPGEPVGFVAGAIDLLYRDPETAELVVADYKTDAVQGEALELRAQGYLAQGAVYTRALERALALAEAPRFEVWFLQAGVVWRAPPLSDSAPRAPAR